MNDNASAELPLNPRRAPPCMPAAWPHTHALLSFGPQALVSVLSSGGAPELISLDLRGNALGDGAKELLVGPPAALGAAGCARTRLLAVAPPRR
jgi:hypothetical protein